MRLPLFTGMLLVGAAAPALTQERSLFDESQVQHLAALSSPGFEAKPDISHDLLTLHYASGQAGGVGDLDLWVAQRPDVNSPFGAPANVAVLNSAWRDHTPTTNADGTLMIFSSNRPGGVGVDDAWMSTRPDASSPWDPPTHLPGINSTERDMGFSMTPDGLSMYFASNRLGSLGLLDLYHTRAIPNIRRYGAGTSGTAGVPRVRPIGGGPSVGNAAFAMEVTNMSSAAWGVWILGSAPAAGPILVSFATTPVVAVFQDALAPNPPPEAPRIIPAPIPDNAALVGVTWFAQIGVLGDPFGQAALPGPVPYAASPGIRGTVF